MTTERGAHTHSPMDSTIKSNLQYHADTMRTADIGSITEGLVHASLSERSPDKIISETPVQTRTPTPSQSQQSSNEINAIDWETVRRAVQSLVSGDEALLTQEPDIMDIDGGLGHGDLGVAVNHRHRTRAGPQKEEDTERPLRIPVNPEVQDYRKKVRSRYAPSRTPR
jgi:hypothetical protein